APGQAAPRAARSDLAGGARRRALLESARRLPTVRTPAGDAIGADMASPLVAAFLLTGGRRAEVLGLELDDVSLDRKTVTFRPNRWRRLKNRRSHRVVPLWPQLEEILRAWIFGRRLEMPGRLCSPRSPRAPRPGSWRFGACWIARRNAGAG